MTEKKRELKRFVEDFGDKILRDEAALFVGAGLSVAAGYVDWKNLLRPVANDLGLDIDRESDLLSIPQYEYNRTRSKQGIRQRLIDSLTRDLSPSVNHDIIARLPIETVWTTNYDSLLEDAYTALGKRIDVKRDNADFSTKRRDSEVTLYKMHGCLDHRDKIVLLKQDYEEYEETHRLFSDKLRGDFIDKTFLFLGYSFSDSNIEAIIARVSSQQKDNKRIHYCVTRIPDDEYDLKKYEHECRERERYGIQTIGVESYDDIPEILSLLETYITKNNVFLAGADVLSSERSKINLPQFCHQLGYKLIKHKYNLVSGFGMGIAGEAILAAYQAISEKQEGETLKQLRVYPFPRGEKEEKQKQKKFAKHRQALISMSGVLVVVSGNKKENDSIIQSSGILEEIKIAKSIKRYIIPVGATGDIAEQICGEAINNPEEFLPGIQGAVESLQKLQNSDNIDDILDTVFQLLKSIQEKSADFNI